MPIPAAIDKFRKENKSFNPSAKGKLYTAQEKHWRRYLDLMELDGEKLVGMLEKHGTDEDADKWAARQALVCAFNLVPSILGMVVDYIFDKPPEITAESDEDITGFLGDADGAGMSFVELVRQEILPLALAMGFVDVLVQNPSVDGAIISKADAAKAGLGPNAVVFTPLQRLDASARPDHSYNWVRYMDESAESTNPFAPAEKPTTYLTLSAAVADVVENAEDAATGSTGETRARAFWVRSFKTKKSGGWEHDGGFLADDRVPVATLYYRRSIDPKRKHFGVSKIAMIAVLTIKIIQVLSWTDEDILANLPLMAIPTQDGKLPKKSDGSLAIENLTTFSYIAYSAQSGTAPTIVQGDVSHIEIKLRLVELYLQEILRLAKLLGASAEAEQITSGVQGVVQRNELFKELSQISSSLDAFTLDVLALVKTTATDETWTAADVKEKAKASVRFHKGPWTMEPLAVLIADTEKLLRIFQRVSPTMATAVMRNLAMSALSTDDPSRAESIKEIEKMAKVEMERQAKEAEALTAATTAATAAKAGAGAGGGAGGPPRSPTPPRTGR